MPNRPVPVRHAPRQPRTPRTPHLFAPTASRPVRVLVSHVEADTEILPHHHPWAQVAFSAKGAVRLTAALGTYLAPPSRAVWVPPGVVHAISAVEDAELHTVYLHQGEGEAGPGVADDAPWRVCRVLEVSELLRALILALDDRADGADGAGIPLDAAAAERERLLAALVLDELRRARPVPVGVPLPADKRLRALCEAVLADPARHERLEDWAADVGASPRTLARLFREELGTSFGQWRLQAVLARAVALAARGTPIGVIAAELGYASASAFTAMVRRTVGQPPSRFFASA